MNNIEQIRIPARFLLNPAHLLSLGFGSGFSAKMPGTMGTVIGVVIYVFLPSLDWLIYLGIIIGAFIIGIFLCGYTAKALSVPDHPGIVWDEIVGYFITMFMVPKEASWILLGFVLFRFFDILKPWPISIVDKRFKGGFGIMFDDVIAGVFSLIIIQIIIYLF